jgi:hypothetical protein
MTKTKKIKTHPVSLNESTLETNIVSEIAALFRNPNGFSYPSRLRWFFDLQDGFPFAQNNKKVKIYRLTPPEEYHGGGWDSKVVIPNVNGTNRAVFIQFKAGKHSNGNTIPNSIFNITLQNPNKHAEFTFNDNSDNTQHQTLKNLHNELVRQGLPSKSVMYGFPRITDLDTFDNLEEDLLLHTTFLSISEMDIKAAANHANLYDGNVHHFRTCYFDETKREISSNPFSIGKVEDSSGLMYEILLVKLAHWRNQLSKEIPTDFINEEFFFMLADFLHINPFNLYDFEYFRPFPPPYERELKDYYAKVESNSINSLFKYFGGNSNEQGSIQWRKDLFNRITRFANERREGNINVQNDIPANFTFSLSEERTLEMSFEQEATYNLLVF